MINSIFGYGSAYDSAKLYSKTLNLQSLSAMSSIKYPFKTSNSTLQQLSSYNTRYNSSDFANYIKGMNTDSNALQSSAASLNSLLKSSVSKMSASSSNGNVLSAASKYGAEAKDYKVQVSQIASAQVNKSADFISNVQNSFTQGTNKISISSGSKTTEVSFSVLKGDNNRQSLERAASAINKSDSGVTASVSVKDNKATLSITSDETGEGYGFSVSDTFGDFAEKSGIDQVASQSKNAKYSVDDVNYESKTNDISIDSGKVEATLKSVGKSEITVAKNTEKTLSAIKDFADDYNNMISRLDNSLVSNSTTSKLSSAFEIPQYMQKNLAEIGINTDSRTGKLSIDENKLKQSIQKNPEKVETFLGKETGGLTAKAEAAVSKVKDTPNNAFVTDSYVSNSTYGYSSGQNSLYNNFAALGLMMNMLV